MKTVGTDISNNQKEGSKYREYDRTIYHCEADDTWANIEEPKE